ncbi:hypothetical protein PISMIDRAFT_10350 [Pisolithus microcarpus 441]|uniref:Uncharacterized protein n=1 Tax=Pisolithus microcarpus 441 TaxID=765257 RepID=A0A0C9ZE50_9AGAM|nr:hypothetical protein PISMIDRAFT_10350 [Pisolithus microcarpus 441]
MSLEVDIPSSISKFPWWCGLSHFKNVLNITFSDGNKKHDLAKENFYACLSILTSYLELDSLIGLDVYMEKTIDMIKSELLRFDRALKEYVECVEVSGMEGLWTEWNFPKAHLWEHIAQDI